MIQKKYLVVLSVIIALVSLGFVFAVPTFVGVGVINNTDMFYSPYEYINFSISTVGSLADNATLVQVNLTSINASACGGTGYLNLVNTTALDGAVVTWKGGCAVSSFFDNSIINPTLIMGGNFSFIAYNETDSVLETALTPILLHNMGMPAMSPGCFRFGSQTTNFSSVGNFANVNFIIQMQINFSCMGLSFDDGTFKDAMMLNLTSINMSDRTIGLKLAGLQSAIQVNITAPHQFGASRIYVNSSAFAELNSNATITLYGLPFINEPDVEGDDPEELNDSSIVWVSNGFDSSKNITTGNLTFSVYGFSGYNASDSALPLIAITSPISNATSISSFNITINGTGTELSQIRIAFNSSLVFVYNSTYNSANCTNITADRAMMRCYSAMNSLADGAYTLNVTAYDYGGDSPGNVNSSTQIFIVDSTGPAIDDTLYYEYSYSDDPREYYNVTLTIAVTDASTAVNTVYFNVTNSSGYQMNYSTPAIKTGNNWSYFIADITGYADDEYSVRVIANDSLNNVNNSEEFVLYVDRLAPSSLTFATISTSRTAMYFNVSIVDATSGISSSCSVDRSGASVAGTGITQNISESGLTCGTNYTYVVNCSDDSGNVNSTTVTYTTDACEDTTSSNSGSGGGIVGVSDTDLTNGYTSTLGLGKIVLFNSNNAQHKFLITNVVGNNVSIKLMSTLIVTSLMTGEEKQFDLNSDGKMDVSVKVNSVSGKTASITLKAVTSSAPAAPVETPATPANEEQTEAKPEANENNNGAKILLTIIGVIIIALIVWLLLRKRSKY
jgi:hypothetical protein